MRRAPIHQAPIAVTLMAVASIAFSQAPQNEPGYHHTERLAESGDADAVDKAAFLFFRKIADMEEMEAGSAESRLRRVLKLEAPAAQQYLKYILEAVDIRTQMGQSLVSETCSNRGNLASPAALDTALNSMMERLEAREVELVKESEMVLGPADKLLVDTYVATNFLPSISVTRTDFRKYMEVTGETPEVLLRRICNR